MSDNNFETLKSIAHEDSGVLEVLINLYLEDTPKLISKIEEECLSKNPDETKKAAHALKGSLLNLGFEEMAHICKEIEILAIEEHFKDIEEKIVSLKRHHSILSEKITELT